MFGLSNAPAEVFPAVRAMHPAFGLMRDIVISSEAGIAKPDPAIFALAAQRAGLSPRPCCSSMIPCGGEHRGGAGAGVRRLQVRGSGRPDACAKSPRPALSRLAGGLRLARVAWTPLRFHLARFLPMADDSSSVDVLNGTAQSQLKAIVERIERLEEDKAAVMNDLKEVYAEAKSNGFDTKVLRKVVRLRKQDTAKRQEEDALLDLYLSAIGGL